MTFKWFVDRIPMFGSPFAWGTVMFWVARDQNPWLRNCRGLRWPRGPGDQRAAAHLRLPCHAHSCHILPFQPILWNKYFPPEPANTAKHSPKSISERGRIWQVWRARRTYLASRVQTCVGLPDKLCLAIRMQMHRAVRCDIGVSMLFRQLNIWRDRCFDRTCATRAWDSNKWLCISLSLSLSLSLSFLYIYIYIYRERERQRGNVLISLSLPLSLSLYIYIYICIHIYIYIYIYTHIMLLLLWLSLLALFITW